MGFWDIFLIGVGLSMDAFAASICKGLSMRKLNHAQAALIALFFGGFQALMPLVGWLLGKQFAQFITGFDHWIAFALLAFIGGKMVMDSLKGEEDGAEKCDRFRVTEILLLAVTTSIDALATGVSFAFFEVQIVPSVLLIGATTFVISLSGVYIGAFFGGRFRQKAELAGGVILILIGLKILLTDLGIFG